MKTQWQENRLDEGNKDMEKWSEDLQALIKFIAMGRTYMYYIFKCFLSCVFMQNQSYKSTTSVNLSSTCV